MLRLYTCCEIIVNDKPLLDAVHQHYLAEDDDGTVYLNQPFDYNFAYEFFLEFTNAKKTEDAWPENNNAVLFICGQ